MTKSIGAAIAAMGCLLTMAGIAQEKGGGDETGPYELVDRVAAELLRRGAHHRINGGDLGGESGSRLHLQPGLPAGAEGGGRRAAAVISSPLATRRASTCRKKDPARHPRWDHVFNVVDRNGKLLESWDQHNKLFVRPHRILVNPVRPRAARLAGRRRRACPLQVHSRRQDAGPDHRDADAARQRRHALRAAH